jgi:hypothetical protein
LVFQQPNLIEAEEIELVDLTIQYQELAELLLKPSYLRKLNLTNVSWTEGRRKREPITLKFLQNYVYHCPGTPVRIMDELNALFPFQIDWNYNRLNMDILIWDPNPKFSSSSLNPIVRSRLRLSTDGELVSNLPFTDIIIGDKYYFELDFKRVELYNLSLNPYLLSNLKNLRTFILYEVNLQSRRGLEEILAKNSRLKYFQLFSTKPEELNLVNLPYYLDTFVLGGSSEHKIKLSNELVVDRLYLTNWSELLDFKKRYMPIRNRIVVESWFPLKQVN